MLVKVLLIKILVLSWGIWYFIWSFHFSLVDHIVLFEKDLYCFVTWNQVEISHLKTNFVFMKISFFPIIYIYCWSDRYWLSLHDIFCKIYTNHRPDPKFRLCFYSPQRTHIWEHLRKFPLALMGVLAPGSAHAWASARPPINTSGNFSAHVSAE